jgi:hypothetical protein
MSKFLCLSLMLCFSACTKIIPPSAVKQPSTLIKTVPKAETKTKEEEK